MTSEEIIALVPGRIVRVHPYGEEGGGPWTATYLGYLERADGIRAVLRDSLGAHELTTPPIERIREETR